MKTYIVNSWEELSTTIDEIGGEKAIIKISPFATIKFPSEFLPFCLPHNITFLVEGIQIFKPTQDSKKEWWGAKNEYL